jgi:NADPH-dependent 2,4-dienoyl-CoA reductase/sulfur reductase-like enzyme
VEIITSGITDKEGAPGMARALAEIMRKNGITKALLDHKKLEIFEGKNIDIVSRPALMKVIGAIMKIRIAEIIRLEQKVNFEFL